MLVEPDGTTGSYILFDKTTLAPIATVNKAGTLTVINGQGNVSFQTTAPLSPDAQKIITDVFALKFTDNTNVNPKTTFAQTDTLTPQVGPPIKLSNGTIVTPTLVVLTTSGGPQSSSGSGGTSSNNQHINLAPSVVAFGGSLTEQKNVTGSSVPDTASGNINFVDINAGDLPTVKVSFTSFTYQNAQHTDVTSSLNALQLADIAAVEANLVVTPTAGNNNNGSATWTYSLADKAFDFLAAGEILTLTYTAEVDSNYAPDNLKSFATFTITITGSNDAPVITSSEPTVAFAGGISTPGGYLTATVPTKGTLSFTDVDLTDTHTVSTALASAVMSGPGVQPGTSVPPGPLQIFEAALSATVATDSTGTGSGIIDWSLANLPVYLADFIPKGDTLTLTYTVTVQDEQGATSTQDVVVTITGTDTPAVVWIATTTTGSPSGGSWSDASNWETGTVPTAADDAIIITDQLIGLTPSYPVTIDAPAFAKSLTMNDYGTLFVNSPTLINQSTLTIGAGGITLSADSIIENGGPGDSSVTISVGGLMEVLDQSSLQNYGQLTLQAGGDFKDQATVTNYGSGTIEVSGGTLNVLVGIANSGLIKIRFGRHADGEWRRHRRGNHHQQRQRRHRSHRQRCVAERLARQFRPDQCQRHGQRAGP